MLLQTGGIPEAHARWFFQQLIIAVDYCHRLGIANRDIKLENTLLDDSRPLPKVKLCDFGYSKDESLQSLCKTSCGTPEYMAPEVRRAGCCRCFWLLTIELCCCGWSDRLLQYLLPGTHQVLQMGTYDGKTRTPGPVGSCCT